VSGREPPIDPRLQRTQEAHGALCVSAMRDMNLRENWPRGFGSSIAQDVARLSELNLSTMTRGRGVELCAPGLRSGYLDGASAGRGRLAGNQVQQRFRLSMPAGEDEHHAGWPSLAAAFLPRSCRRAQRLRAEYGDPCRASVITAAIARDGVEASQHFVTLGADKIRNGFQDRLGKSWPYLFSLLVQLKEVN